MRVKLLAKDQSSGGQGCPSGYLGDNGMCVIQGPEVDDDTYANLANVLPGEKGVVLRPQVILDLANQLRALG